MSDARKLEPPSQEGDLADWLADSLVYIQTATTDLVREVGNLQGRIEDDLKAIKKQAGGDGQWEQAIGHLKMATEDFNKAGHQVDQKRREFVMRPILILGVVMLVAMTAQTLVMVGGKFWGADDYGLSAQNAQSLQTCIEAVKADNQAYRCTLVIRPDDFAAR